MKVILGVSGSIAAYKSAHLTRLFVKRGNEVQVLMTRPATDFISPLTLSTLSKRQTLSDVHSETAWNNHVELGLWGDALVIAPATANTIAKLAGGICDNILTAVYLSARCPVFVAPAMDLDMWKHPATQRNISLLREFGVHIIPVEHGELASGLTGDGRMAEPENIVAFLDSWFKSKTNLPLAGKKALVTAGPTFEPLDPVRFLGNHSTGKMGIAIAEELSARGADVTLVLGPTHLRPTDNSIRIVSTGSALDMYHACSNHFPESDIAVFAAAVADYKPRFFSETKIKKKDDDLVLELEKTVDIAAVLGQKKTQNQIMVGFALETDNEENNAVAKLKKKNLDLIVLNSMKDAGAGFGHDTNKVSIIGNNGDVVTYELKHKKSVATDIVNQIIRLANPNHS